jgi:hypothetical protein
MLTVRVLRIEEVLWNSSFIIEIPGAMTEEHSGLKDIVSELFKLEIGYYVP